MTGKTRWFGTRRDMDSSFGTDVEEEEFNWEKFIKEEGGQAAPPEAFWHPKTVPVNKFVKGQILNCQDAKLRLEGSYLARILKVYKCFVCVQFVELTRVKFWTMCDSHLLFPFSETTLRRHPDNVKTEKSYEKWLMRFMEENSNNIVPVCDINKVNHDFYPKINLFKRGMVLAYMDNRNFTGKVSPAIVTEVKGAGMLKLRLLDSRGNSEVSVMYDDRCLFSIDFTKKAEIPVRCPKNKKKTPLKILNSTRTLRLPAGKDKTPTLPPEKGKKAAKRGRPFGAKNRNRRGDNENKTLPCNIADDQTDMTEIDMDISFHPQSSSTPLRSKNSNYDSSMHETTMQNYTIQEHGLNYTVSSNISPANISTPPKNVFTQINQTPPASLKNTPSMNLQETWQQAFNKNINSQNITPLATTIRNCYATDLGMAQLNFGKFSGAYLRMDLLGSQIPFLPVLNYKMQFYNIATALAESTTSPHAAMDIMCPGNLSFPARMTIYVRSNETTVPKKIPNPHNFESACEWIRYFLRRLRADEQLVTLHKVG